MPAINDAKLDDRALDQLFRTARSYNGYTDAPVSEAELHALWELMKWGADLGQPDAGRG